MKSENELVSIVEDILRTVRYDMENSVPQPIVGRADIVIDNSVEVIWFVRNELKGYFHKGYKVLSYYGKGGELIHKNLGIEFDHQTPSGKKTILLNSISKYIPNVISLDAIQAKIITKDQAYEIGSLKEFIESYNKDLDEIRELQIRKAKKQLLEREQEFIGKELRKKLSRLQKDIDHLTKVKQNIIYNATLRDQPILDKYQDSIFRINPKAPLIVTGAPGTGKTTLLIKRIKFLSSESIEQYRNDFQLSASDIQTLKKVNSWTLFTPNEVLKLFLKDALGAELLNTNNVEIWHKYRKFLIGQFSLANPSKGPFSLLKDDTKIIASKAVPILISEFYNYYSEHQLEKFSLIKNFDFRSLSIGNDILEFQNAYLTNLSQIKTVSGWIKLYADIQTTIITKLKPLEEETILNLRSFTIKVHSEFNSNPQYKQEIHEYLKIGKDVSDEDKVYKLNSKLKKIVEEVAIYIVSKDKSDITKDSLDIYRRYKSIFDNTTFFSDGTKSRRRATDIKFNNEIVSSVDLFEEDPNFLNGLMAELDLSDEDFKNLIEQRIINTENSMIPVEKREPIANYKGSANFSRSSIRDLGEKLFLLKLFKPFSKGIAENIMSDIPEIYKLFRKLLIVKHPECLTVLGRSVLERNQDKPHITNEEIDFVLFIVMQCIRSIYKNNNDEFLNSRNSYIRNYRNNVMKGIVAIDESADFSVLELGCMASMSDPSLDCVILSGDLMQRMSLSGINNWEEFNALFPKTNMFTLSLAYRQSPVLLKIAQKLYENTTRTKPSFSSPYSIEDHHYLPLKYRSENPFEKIDWIIERIFEIQNIHNGILPSTAIFVKDEDSIQNIHEMLENKLMSTPICVESCEKGKILGDSSSLRIFNIEHIKGLEFQAVFFWDIDEIEKQFPDLIDKYLYVGLTRAAELLAVTYNIDFPRKIRFIEKFFNTGSWRKSLSIC